MALTWMSSQPVLKEKKIKRSDCMLSARSEEIIMTLRTERKENRSMGQRDEGNIEGRPALNLGARG